MKNINKNKFLYKKAFKMKINNCYWQLKLAFWSKNYIILYYQLILKNITNYIH